MRTRLFSALLAAILGVAFAGCLESDENYTLNPDGRGKVVIAATISDPASMFGADDDDKPDPKEKVDAFVRDILESSTGVETWKDISCRVLPDDKIEFKGTAYFRDLNELKIHQVSSSNTFIRQENPDGTWSIVLKQDPKEEQENMSAPENLSEEEITARVDSMRSQYEVGRSMMGPILEGIKQRYVFTVPATPSEYSTFTRLPKGGYEYVMSGRKVLALMDSIASSDAFWRQAVISGESSGISPDRQKELTRMMFGEGGIPMLKVKGGKELFNYDAEVKAARKKYPVLLKKFGIKGE